MSIFDRIRDAASKAASQAAEGAERLAKQVASSNVGFIAAGAQEILAEREYRRARALTEGGVTRLNADETLAILTPYAEVDCAHNVLIAQLMGDAHNALDQDEEARQCYERALAHLRDPLQRQESEPIIFDDLGILGDELEARLLNSTGALALAHGQPEICVRNAVEALRLDPHAHLSYYLQAAGMLARGVPAEAALEVLVKALDEVPPETVRSWVQELAPAHAAWFDRLTK